jgi:hypothetical protein
LAPDKPCVDLSHVRNSEVALCTLAEEPNPARPDFSDALATMLKAKAGGSGARLPSGIAAAKDCAHTARRLGS